MRFACAQILLEKIGRRSIGVKIFLSKMKATFPGVKMMVSGGVARCFHRPMGDGRMTLLDMAPDFGSKSPVAKDKVQKQKVQNAAVVLANQDIAANHLLVQQDLVTLAGKIGRASCRERVYVLV